MHDKIIFMHYSLQIKQDIHLIGIFRAPVVTQFIVKVYRKIEKVPFLKFTISLLVNIFCKSVSCASSDIF